MKNNITRCILLLATSMIAHFCIGQKRFKNPVFTSIDSSVNILYGEAINIKGEKEQLLMDVLMPAADTMKHRPLVIFIHGGGFQSNTKNSGYSSQLCQNFAKRGYVTATINYRLGVEKSFVNAEGKMEKTNADYTNALFRAQQDGKAAIRFFRKYADQYGIDTTQIFITGSSAGAMTCLAIAYMDEDEIPATVDRAKWGSLEGESGNSGYSSKVSGVMNAWGAMIDYRWIQNNDVPLYNTAGTIDKTVPYDSAYDYHGFKYGPYILYRHCLSLGISTAWRPFEGAGHTLDSDKIKQDSCINEMADWLYTRLKLNNAKNNEGVLRWEKEMKMFDSLNMAEHNNKKAVMFLGSSYIRLWKHIREDLQYPDVIHRGFGGCNLADVAYHMRRIVFPHQPKALFIYVGNDIVAADKDKSPREVFELYKYIVSIVREKYPKMPITWLAISPSEKRWSVYERICEANNMIKAYAATQPGLFYIDAGYAFLGEDGKPNASLYRDDHLHYNEQGYKLWGSVIRNQVKRIIKRHKS